MKVPIPDFTTARGKVDRATEHRVTMGAEHRQSPPPTGLRADVDGSSCQLYCEYDCSSRLSYVFGDWLANMRAAVDYAFFQIAVHETRQDPPTRQRTRQFPITRDPADFAQRLTSQSNPLHGFRQSTIDMIERMQPYNGTYGPDGDALLWLHDLARIERHRGIARIGGLIRRFDATVVDPASRLITAHWVSDYRTTPMVVDPGEAVLLAEFRCASTRDARRVAAALTADVDTTLEVTDWFRDAHVEGRSANIRNDNLEERMTFLERMWPQALDTFERDL